MLNIKILLNKTAKVQKVGEKFASNNKKIITAYNKKVQTMNNIF